MTTNVAMETIAFQDPQFFKDLVLLFKEIRENFRNSSTDLAEYSGEFSRIVKKYTNMNTRLSTIEYGPMAVVDLVNNNNVLLNNNDRADRSSFNAALELVGKSGGNVARGSVNIRTGKVTGIFEEIQTTIIIPKSLIVYSVFTDEELAALALHEIGHPLVMFEYISRTTAVNQLLAHASRLLDNSDNLEERVTLITTIKNKLDLDNVNAEELASTKNSGAVISVVLADDIREKVRNELGTDITNYDSWEVLADQYATRMGAGRHLVTGLYKTHKWSGEAQAQSRAAHLIAQTLLATSVIATTAFIPLLGIFYATALLGTADSIESKSKYNTPIVRLTRIRNQLIERAKQRTVTKEELDDIKVELKAIDTVLDKMNDQKTIVEHVLNFFSGKRRRLLKANDLQQDLESLVSNDLFIRAKELKLN